MRKKLVATLYLGLLWSSSVFALIPGDDIGELFMGIQAKSRGDGVSTKDAAEKHQCVDLTRDFATDHHGGNFSQPVGCAANMWLDLPQKYGYVEYLNSSSEKPRVGDFMVWWEDGWDCKEKFGHVAIVAAVSSSDVFVFEQNIAIDDPYRVVPMSQDGDGNWNVESGLGGAYFVKGWLRYPGFSAPIGMDFNGNIHQEFVDAYDRASKIGDPGLSHDDGSGPFVHNWEPFRYLVKNLRNAKGEESAIMYDPLNGGQAYLISGTFWEWYSKGESGRYGPDIPILDNNGNPTGQTVGAPTSDAGRDAAGKLLQRHENGYEHEGSVEFHRLDGTLIYYYDPIGDTSPLTITGEPQSENHNTIRWYGGLLATKYLVYRNGQFIGETTLFEFTEAGLLPGDVSKYIVYAVDSADNVIDQSNEITIVNPGAVGSFTVEGAPDGHTYIYAEWDDIGAPYYLVFFNGVQVAKTTLDRRSFGPLEPNTTYRIKIVATTASNLVLDSSNVVEVTTDLAPPDPPLAQSVPTTIVISLPKVHWIFGETGYVTAVVLDQFGNVTANQRALFIGSDGSVMPVSADSGYLIAHGLGDLEVWAELYDDRSLKSERVHVEVVEATPAVPSSNPDIFPSAPLVLFKKIEQAFDGPIVEGRTPMFKFGYLNPNDFPVSFYGPSIWLYNLEGEALEFSSYSATLKTLQPGESWEGNASGVYVLGPGIKYLQAQIRLEGSAVDEWHVIDQGDDGVPTKTYIEVISETDLRPDIRFNSISATSTEYLEGDTVIIRMWLVNPGDVDAIQPFTLTGGVVGRDSQSIEIPSLNRGDLLKVEMVFSGLPAGNHKIDFWADSGDVVPEYDEGNNMRSLIVEIQAIPDTPGLVISPQISDITIVRDYNDPCGPYQDEGSPNLNIYTRQGINRFGRGLLNFDLSDLPPGVKIEYAYIDLHALMQGEYVDNNFYLNLLTETFDPSFVDWCSRDSQNLWQNSGSTWTNLGQAGVFISSAYTGGWHYQTGAVNRWFTWDVTQMIQAVADGQFEFKGFIIRQDDLPNASENQSIDFASMDHPNSNFHPRLVIQYGDAPPEPEQFPDLLLERVDFSSQAKGRNSNISADVWVKNGGTQDATAFSVEVKVVESGNVYTTRIDSLLTGSSVPISISEKLRKASSATLQITIDTQDEVIESDESNNYIEDSHAL